MSVEESAKLIVEFVNKEYTNDIKYEDIEQLYKEFTIEVVSEKFLDCVKNLGFKNE